MADGRFVYRFQRDLRLEDHAGPIAAASRGPVIPALVLDEPLAARLRRSPRRATFFCGAAAALDAELRERGSRLIVRRGAAGAALVELAREANASGVAWSAGYDAQTMLADERLQYELEEAGLEAVIVHDAPAIPPDETAAARTIEGPAYRAFAPYFDVWRELRTASYENPLLLRFAVTEVDGEPLPEPAEFGGQEVSRNAGAAAARNAFSRFLRADATHYAQRANVPAEDATSHMSAHLSFGTISARSMVCAIRDRLNGVPAAAPERLSFRLILRALARRDFFLQLSLSHPDSERLPLQEKMRGFPFAGTDAALEAWRDGETGFPLVDAGVRQLRETGWMHPLVRAVAASFLCFDLGVEWQAGCDEWDRHLIEDDPALAVGNWQWIAGVGADMAQYPRIYNPERQRKRIDPDGTYVRRWIPELERVPIREWSDRFARRRQLAFDLSTPGGYPRPVVDHDRVARAFLARYRAFVSSPVSQPGDDPRSSR